jgi:hypothetical protein
MTTKKALRRLRTFARLFYDPQFGAFPKIQILTIEDLLSGKEGSRYPDMARGGLNFKKARKEKGDKQQKLFD